MGLDMRIYRDTYVKNWDHMEPREKHTIAITGPSANAIKPERISYIREEIIYWRKANQIFAFVESIVGEITNGADTYIDPEHLKTLVTNCKKVIAQPALGPTLLPTSSGFFFGSTDYDEWYISDLKHTVDVLGAALKEKNKGYYYFNFDW